MIKVVLFCQACEDESDALYGVDGLIHHKIKEVIEAPVEFISFGGYIGGDRAGGFIETCGDADLIILDAWTHPTHPTQGSWSSEDAQSEMARIANRILAANPKVILFAQMLEGAYEVEVHQYALLVSSHKDEVIFSAARYVHARKISRQQEGDRGMRILVMDDSFDNLEAAEVQLGRDHDLTTVQTFSQARELISEGNFDVVMTDVFLPSESSGLSELGEKFVGQLIDIGLVAALLALKYEVPKIFILSDTGHHDHPIAWAMDSIAGGKRIVTYCGDDCPKTTTEDGRYVKDWARALT